MHRIVVAGAGKIGGMIAEMLSEGSDYDVVVVDRDVSALEDIRRRANVRLHNGDLGSVNDLVGIMTGAYAVLSAAPFQLTSTVAEAAAKANCHYLDLTEDVATTRRVKQLAVGAGKAFIPQCGLAPGFISIAASSMARKFDELDTVRLRVGALPRYATNTLGYNLTWSTDGVINEYLEPCEAVVDGKPREVPALEELESFALDGVTYEAFNTSGGLGSLAEVLGAKVRNLNYKSIRYPGHCALMKTLLGDLGLRRRRDLLKEILENALPATNQDVVVIFVTVSGKRNNKFVQESYASRVFGEVRPDGREHSAIQITTAAGICTVLDLLVKGRLPAQGFVRQEEIELNEFLSNRFGRAYRGEVSTIHRAAA